MFDKICKLSQRINILVISQVNFSISIFKNLFNKLSIFVVTQSFFHLLYYIDLKLFTVLTKNHFLFHKILIHNPFAISSHIMKASSLTCSKIIITRLTKTTTAPIDFFIEDPSIDIYQYLHYPLKEYEVYQNLTFNTCLYLYCTSNFPNFVEPSNHLQKQIQIMEHQAD